MAKQTRRRRPQPEGLTGIAGRHPRRDSSTMSQHRLLVAARISARNPCQRGAPDLCRGSLGASGGRFRHFQRKREIRSVSSSREAWPCIKVDRTKGAYMRVVRILFIVATTAALTGCEVQARAVPKGSPTSTQPRVGTGLPPLRGVIGVDESGSMNTARVPLVTVPSLAPIFDRLETSGGAPAIAFITDQSNAPLLRLYVPRPPDAPLAHRLSGNLFDPKSFLALGNIRFSSSSAGCSMRRRIRACPCAEFCCVQST